MQQWCRTVWGLVAAGAALSLAACVTPATHVSADGEQENPVANVCPETRGWVAWVNAMPGPGMVPTLIVEGEVNVPAGQAAALDTGPLDRMMPPAQRFALRIAPADTGADTSGGWRKVRAELAPAQPEYRAVLIGCHDQTLAEITSVTRAY